MLKIQIQHHLFSNGCSSQTVISITDAFIQILATWIQSKSYFLLSLFHIWSIISPIDLTEAIKFNFEAMLVQNLEA